MWSNNNNNNNNNRFMALCPGLLGEPVPEETPTNHPDHHPILSASSIYHNP